MQMLQYTGYLESRPVCTLNFEAESLCSRHITFDIEKELRPVACTLNCKVGSMCGQYIGIRHTRAPTRTQARARAHTTTTTTTTKLYLSFIIHAFICTLQHQSASPKSRRVAVSWCVFVTLKILRKIECVAWRRARRKAEEQSHAINCVSTFRGLLINHSAPDRVATCETRSAVNWFFQPTYPRGLKGLDFFLFC